MSESDLRYLMLPDDGLPQERHDVLKERVMASVRTEPQQQPTAGSRFRYRLAPVLASIAAVVLITGAAAAMGLFPRQAQLQLDELGCRDAASAETLVATADATDGRTFQFWTTSPGPDAAPNGFVLVEVGGDSAGGTIGCNTPGASLGEIWVATPAEASIQGTLVSVMGHVPVSATVVEVTFDDGATVRTDVQIDGYFLELVHGPGVDMSPGNPEPNFPEAIHITAIDADGNVIADQDL